eukprot:CAMPEP_0172468220 /NCGR_PEP_ID=MMETSP1065-20121228/60863_1 /TAXON_ID=265537 /ORGANISM="Amphiprora paludosa, Strain CCMP125" /LENGTH=416 /DNA_ID=CAMNT_0013225573 /DNA_START=96 /DNA_END=1346 /DNA_ORIENTATION=+
MVKNWADHCSSDEEDLLDDEELNQLDAVAEQVLKKEFKAPTDEAQAAADQVQAAAEDEDAEHAAPPPQEEAAAPPPKQRTYEFPTDPPFTAYVGNLAYSIVDPQELAHLLTELAKNVLDLDIVITDTRIMMERNYDRDPDAKPRHRGFGYVQMETLEMLQGFMGLNDTPQAMVAGRKIQVDTSTQRNNNRNSGYRNKDHNSHSNNRHSHNNNNNNSFQRHDRRGDRDGRGGGGFSRPTPTHNNNADEPAAGNAKAPSQRPRLQLAPRTKPLAKKEEGSGGSSSNIFGGGKARDAQGWRSNKESDKTEKAPAATNEEGAPVKGKPHHTNHKEGPRKHHHHDAKKPHDARKQTPQGGRGGRGGGRGRGGRGGDAKKTEAPPAAKAPAPAPPATKAPEKAESKAPTNHFAALGFDSDSD